MAKFAAPAKQAASVMKTLQGNTLKSVGTVRNYEQALTRVTEYIQAQKLGGLRDLSRMQAITYLQTRAKTVGQKTLDMERQAIQMLLQHITHQLQPDEHLPIIKSVHQQSFTSRAYSREQVHIIAQAQAEKNTLATEIAYAAGLRAHELFTLQPIQSQPPHLRPMLTSKWQGRSGQFYTVQGKGGLIRSVLIPTWLAQRLEAWRLPQPRMITDRGIHYQQYYDINGGHRWSRSFSSASQCCLGWSTGAHGLRHSYAQERMQELQKQGFSQLQALETVSQEMGHFRSEITKVYLR